MESIASQINANAVKTEKIRVQLNDVEPLVS